MIYTFHDIANITDAVVLQSGDDHPVEELLLDSRKLAMPSVTLFIALAGPTRSGVAYLSELYAKGVRKFLVGPDFAIASLSNYPEAGFLLVAHPIHALQQLAAYHRNQFNYPVVGITGSNGKTIIKEWLNQLLHNHFDIVRSPKSYNSQIGVPLSVWQMNRYHNLGIFEAGISTSGEMQRLQHVIRPTMGILAYMGAAHADGFLDMSQKLEEKLLLFQEVEQLVYCADDENVAAAMSKLTALHPGISLKSWSRKISATLQCLQVEKHGMITDLICLYQGEEFAFSIPFTDEASIYNALTVCLAALSIGLSRDVLLKELSILKPIAMRLELKPGINQCSIINDSYSADWDSLSIALDFLFQQDQQVRKTVILSDMQHPPGGEAALYGKVAQVLNTRNIEKLIAVGPELSRHKDLFSKLPQTRFYADTKSLKDDLTNLGLQQEVILLKGSRKFGFEELSRQLEQKLHDTVMEIDLHALRNNLRTYRRMLRPKTKMMVMVKAFGYGSGLAEIAALMQREGVEMLAVAYADEGVELRRAGIHLPIMVMNVSEAGFENLIKYRLEPELYSPTIFSSFTAYLSEKQLTDYPVHIKFDTGMHRLGFMKQDLTFLVSQISDCNRIKIKSVFTHLVASEDPLQDQFTNTQFQLFSSFSDQISATVGYHFDRHVCNSAAISRFPDFHLEMVRLGIGLYGAGAIIDLQPVATLKTTIAQIKHLQPGDTVGYGRKGKVEKPSSIATVRIGYADGYPRSLGNGIGKMSVGDQLVPVIGNVCMDMTMLDITGVEAHEGDEVVVFGNRPTVAQVAGWAGTIAYEILTNISQRVKRVYFEE